MTKREDLQVNKERRKHTHNKRNFSFYYLAHIRTTLHTYAYTFYYVYKDYKIIKEGKGKWDSNINRPQIFVLKINIKLIKCKRFGN